MASRYNTRGMAAEVLVNDDQQNPDVGRQVVDNADYPIQYELNCDPPARKKSA